MRVLAAALLVALCSAWVSPGHAAAQLPLGSLVVTVTSPAQGSTVGGTAPVVASVSIIGNLTVRDVRFTVDGVNLGTADSTPPYSVSWNTRTASNGTHTLRAIARDLLGITYSSSPITVTVFNDLTPPAVAMTGPAAGAAVSGTIAVAASASDNVAVAGVQFRLDGSALGPEDTQEPYAVSWNTTSASNGSHTLTAVARDAAGNSTTSTAVSVTVRNDKEPPAVAITAPAAGATVNGAVSVTAAASDDIGVAGVQFRLDGANLGAEDTAAPYAVAWDTTAAGNGSHALTAVARDTSGKTTTSVQVTVAVRNDTEAPAVALTAPAPGATVSGSVTVAAAASDDIGVIGVQFRLDGASLGAEDSAAPYSVPWNTATVANGSHTLTAVARDASGKSTTSAPVALTVRNDTASPTITITSPAAGTQVKGTVVLAAEATDDTEVVEVRFLIDGMQQGAALTTRPFELPWDTTTAADGPHTITATAVDGAGNTTTSGAVGVTVENETASETTTRLQETASSIAYTGSWSQGNTAKAWSGGTAALATGGPDATGSPTRATLTFTGTGVSWIGFRGPQTGIARVLLDGTLVATVDTYSATDVLEAALYTVSGLPSAPHTLAVESTGTRNPASSDIFIIVDAFDVTSAGGGSDTTPPTISITAPAAGATVSGTVAIAASAADNVGVTRVRFFVDGAQVGPDIVNPPYSAGWDTTSTANGSHTITAEARDAAGNVTTSTAVAVTVANDGAPAPSSTVTRFEETNLSILYTPGSIAPERWWHGSRSRTWSAVTSSFNRSAGARATFPFTGTSVSWIGFRAPWAGIADVFVDGTFVQRIDLYLGAGRDPSAAPCPQPPSAACVDEETQVPVFTRTGLPAGSHTLTIEVTGLRNARATDNAVVLDAFDVAPAMAPATEGTRAEETSQSATYSAGWIQGDTSAAWSGGTAATSSAAAARASFAFSGTSVNWVGLRAPHTGIARVYLDGAFQAEVDTYSGAAVQGVLYSATHLAPGRHELAIEVTGRKHTASSGHLLVIDAFDVRSRFEDSNPVMVYTGTWSAQNFDKAWSGTSANTGSGTALLSSTAGARAAFTFTGTSVSWIGFRGPQTGIARVHLDGALVAEVDTYAAVEEVRAAIFTRSALAPDRPHTLEIEVTGAKNASSSAAIVVIDAFDVTPAPGMPQVTRFQQIDAAYPTGGWLQSTPSSLYSGQTVTLSTTVGARAEFTFTGTAIRWVGQRRRDAGIARVYVDGVFAGEVDTFSAIQDDYQVPVFTRTGLAPGQHTLAIEVTGLKHPESSSTQVILDAFDVSQ